MIRLHIVRMRVALTLALLTLAAPAAALALASPAAATPAARKEVTVAAKLLDACVGDYALSPAFHIAITREGAGLAAQATGQPRFPLFAESEAAFFFKVVDAQIAFVKDASGKVTGLVLHQNGADMSGKKVSSVPPAAPAPKVRKEVTVEPKLLDSYVGEYTLAPTFSIVVVRQATGLAAQATGQPQFPLFAESPTEFFYKVVDAQVSFVKDASGKVSGLVLHQGGADMPGQKVSKAK